MEIIVKESRPELNLVRSYTNLTELLHDYPGFASHLTTSLIYTGKLPETPFSVTVDIPEYPLVIKMDYTP